MRTVVCILAWIVGGVALPGTFHETLICADCHSGRGVDGPGIRPADDGKLCLGCHDGSSAAPDVLQQPAAAGRASSFAGDGGRSAGSLSYVADWAGGGASSEHAGHTIGSTRPPPGFSGVWPQGARLTCRSCHAAHPNGNYRNLGPDPLVKERAFAEQLFPEEAQPSFAIVPEGAAPGAADADVLLIEGRPPHDAGSVVFSTNGGRNAMNEFCASCHSQLHGTLNTRLFVDGLSVDPPRYIRHPTSGVAIEGRTRAVLARSRSMVRLNWREDGTPEVACLTCHRAHGSTHSFGLVFWDPAAPRNGENGAGGQVEALCMTCHSFEDSPDLPPIVRRRAPFGVGHHGVPAVPAVPTVGGW